MKACYFCKKIKDNVHTYKSVDADISIQLCNDCLDKHFDGGLTE